MSLFSSKKFIAKLADSGELPPRAARRVYINADAAKTARLCAGDAIALADADKAHGSKVRILNSFEYWLDSHSLIGFCRWHRVAFPRIIAKQWV